jgi:hypothetical protein
VSAGGSADGDPVVRGSLEEGAFSAFWLTGDGRLSAALAVGRPEEVEEARRMIAARGTPDRDALADPDAELSSA